MDLPGAERAAAAFLAALGVDLSAAADRPMWAIVGG
jgi:hydrogenase/urease accessory protein HupE